MSVEAIAGYRYDSPRATARIAVMRSVPTACFRIYPETPALMSRLTYSLSSYWLKIRILISGWLFLISTAASSPPRPGIAMSRRTMSGFSRSAFWIVSLPSDASPRTSTSSWRFRIAMTPSRTRAWSSATRILVFAIGSRLPSQPAAPRARSERYRHENLDSRSHPRLRLHGQPSVQEGDALLHPEEPEPLDPALLERLEHLFRVEAPAVVLDLQVDAVV